MRLTQLSVVLSYIYIVLTMIFKENNDTITILGMKFSLMFMVTLCWFIYLLGTLIFFKNIKIIKESKYIVLIFNAIILIACLSTIGESFTNLSFKIPPLLYSFLIVNSAFLFYIHLSVSRMDLKKYLHHISIIIIIVQVIFLIYVGNYGRFASQLGGSAVLHLVFTLTFVIFISNFIKKKRMFDLVFILLSAYLLLLTQSRAGLVAFLLIVILALSVSKIKLRNKVGLSVIFLIGFIFIYQFISVERFKNFESSARSQSFETSLEIFANSDKPLFGLGVGEVWPWYNYEIYGVTFDAHIYSIYGYTLTNPHSVYLGILVEIGLIAFLIFMVIPLILLRAFYESRKFNENNLDIILMGVIMAFLVFSQDYYLFKNFSISYIWWIFVFMVMALVYEKKH